jgi:hypothetical protein
MFDDTIIRRESFTVITTLGEGGKNEIEKKNDDE